MKKFASVLVILSVLLMISCGEKKSETEKKADKKNEATEKKVSSAVVFGGSYYSLNDDGSLSLYDNVIPGTVLEPVLSNGKTDIQFLSSDGGLKKSHVHVKMDDNELWVDERLVVLNSIAAVTLESGTEIFLYEHPDVDSKKTTKLASELILAITEKCSSTKEYPEASKFSKVKIPTNENGEYLEGFVRNSNMDSSTAQVAFVQVKAKYNQLLKKGNVAPEILHELEDTMEDLRSWNGR